MGVVFFAGLILILVLAGGVGILVSTAGIILFARMGKKGKRWGKPLAVLSAFFLAGAILLEAIPVYFFGFIYLINTLPPDDFVETDIVIEENGYQDTRFTADGVVYEVLEFSARYDGCKHSAVPVFSYKTSGFLNGSQCGNYYRVSNSCNADLIWDGGEKLYCPAEEKARVTAFYRAQDGKKWFMRNWGESFQDVPVPSYGEELLAVYAGQKSHSEPDHTFLIPQPCLIYWAASYSSDGVVRYRSCEFSLINDRFYDMQSSRNTGAGYQYEVKDIPPELNEFLLQFHSTGVGQNDPKGEAS